MKQNKTITQLFETYLDQTESENEFDLLMSCFDMDENEVLLKRLIRKQLNSDLEVKETSPIHRFMLSDSYNKIKGRITRQ